MLSRQRCDECAVMHLYCDRCRSHSCLHVIAVLGLMRGTPDAPPAIRDEEQSPRTECRGNASSLASVA
jgi:hypothetical protein